jgi:hypothetical protein
MHAHAIRRTVLFLALASLSGLATAAGSQAGDNGRQPMGADNEGPRIALPDANLAAEGEWHSYDSHGYYAPYRYYAPRAYSYYVAPPTYYAPRAYWYYSAPPAYYVSPYYGGTYYAYNDADRARALSLCESRPLAERPACRDAVVYGRY